MTQRIYYSTHEATIFIGGWWLDDAQAIQWQVADPKEPIYGFRDRYFRDIAEGQTIVHGALDINFRKRGYLSEVIEQFSSLRGGSDDHGPINDEHFARLLQAVNVGNDFLNNDIDPRGLSPDAMLEFLRKPFAGTDVRGVDMPRFRRIAKAMRETFYDGDPQDAAGITEGGSLPRPGEQDRSIDIHVVYEDPEESNPEADLDTTRVRLIYGVRFVAESQVLMNAVPGGGEPVIERYQFLAKNVI